MKQVPDRKKLGQEYLRKKRKPLATIAWQLTFILIWLPAWYVARRPLFFLCFIAVLYLLALVWKIPREYKEAKRVSYVPPVTADTLPTEEVLVR